VSSFPQKTRRQNWILGQKQSARPASLDTRT
jgi:hypothetical protein